MSKGDKIASAFITIVFLAIVFFIGKAIVEAMFAPVAETPSVEQPAVAEPEVANSNAESSSEVAVTASVPEKEIAPYDDVEVYGNAKAGILNQLKSPRTAKFPSASKASIIQYESEKFFVRSYVDSENSFGAMIRSEWFVDMEYIGDNIKFNEIIIK